MQEKDLPGRPAQPGRRRVLGAGLAGAAALFAGPLVRAQGANKLTISYPTRSGASWPLWIAKHAGIYQKHGYDVTLEYGVHPAGIAALISGQAQMINYGLEQIIAAASRDPSLVMMGSSLNKGNFALVAHSSVAKVEDLKGKRIGVGRLGDTLYVYTVALLKKYGLGPRDVQWVSTGTDATSRANMLTAGQLDAALMVAPSYFRLEPMGYRTLDVLANHDDIFVSTAYVFKKSWVKENPDAPTKLIMAHAEAIKRFYDDKPFAVEAYRAFDPQQPATVERLYDTYASKQILDRVPLLQKAAVESAVERVMTDNAAVKNVDLAQVIDMGPVRKLIADGYFRKLFGADVAQEEQRKLAASY